MSPVRTRTRPPVGFIEPCLPSPAAIPPAGPGWLHEIKHDGYRLMVRKDAGGIRLLTRRGIDWTRKFPLIAAAANRLGGSSFLIDGEACCLDEIGVASFAMLRRSLAPAILYAFDLVELNGGDLRREPIEARKAALAKLLASCKDRLPAGIAITDHAVDEDGPALFRHACAMGLEGIVSKRLGSRYKSGRSYDWIKAKNPESAAVMRESTEDWS